MADASRRLIEIEVVYALPQAQAVVTLEVPQGSTVGEAIEISGIAAQHPEIDLSLLVTGIFGRRVPLTAVLHEYDRVEIYRQLIADPKQARRKRASRTAKAKR